MFCSGLDEPPLHFVYIFHILFCDMVGENNVTVSNTICAFPLVFSDGVGGVGR